MSKNWPALIIGIVVLVYWSRVLMMVRRSRKKAGHGANLVPPEPLGRILRIVWMPVILLWIMLPLVAFIAKRPERYPATIRPIFRTFWLPSGMGWMAAIVAIICLLATFVCWQRMGSSWRMGIDPQDKTQLVFSGPFAFVRHPIYGLSSMLMLATLLAVPNVLMFATGGVHLILLQWEAHREEMHLIKIHGDEYLQYSRHTGRFFPRSFRAYTHS